MRSGLLVLVLCGFTMLSMGCSAASYSKNMRAATAQATATVSVKELLDVVAIDKYDATKTNVVTVCAEVSKFLDTGKIGDLPIDKAKEAVVNFMLSKGWSQYVPMVSAFFDIIANQTVPIEKIGADSIQIIKDGLDAAAVSAQTSKLEWRKQDQPSVKGMKVRKWRTKD